MTGKSAKIIIITAFNVCDLQMLTMKNHLISLSKVVNVKHRSKGKYQLVLPLARKLVEAGHVKINVEADKVNYRNIKRSELEIISDLRKLIGNAQAANSNDTQENVSENTFGSSQSQSSQIPAGNSQSQGSQIPINGQSQSMLQPTAVNSDDDETQDNNCLTFSQIFS